MTAKEYLNQARHLDALINCRLHEIDYWRDLSSSVSGTRFDGMPHSPNRPTEAPFVRCLEKIDEIQRSVEEKVAYLVRLKEEINTAIDMLENRDEQLVLRYRYLDDCTWEEISRMLNVSLRTVHRIHGSALQNFSVPD
jgi:RNA polymerase sigma factor (sigma-70 family)|uniref:Sigma70 n=1 Tax=Siphoviridae sp. ctSA812 TaxID=2825508 RepID=A0A8S5U3I2_9CAUD|nr:MAG TPA: Sigma70 [Siphoviridae sp. ctSA812]